MGGGGRCFLCNNERSADISLHRIPKQPSIRLAWIKFCSLNEDVDDVSNLQICSLHFTSADYLEPRAKMLGSRLRLKPNSIPSILKPGPLSFIPTASHDVNELLDVESERHCSVQYSYDDQSSGRTSPSTDSLMSCESQSEVVEYTIYDDNSSERSSPSTVSLISCEAQSEGSRTPDRSRFCEPRYVGDINSSHLATPRTAKISLNLVKKRMTEQAKKLKALKQENRKLIKKVSSLEDYIIQLVEKS